MSISIALKSINQYRKRDIIAYLSLRYYLGSKSSRTDLWANEVAVSLSLKKKSSGLLKIKHFKGYSEEEAQFRDIFIPSPNDIIAESALISKCSEYEIFHTNSSVYSYLINNDDRSVFQHYTNGLRKRYNSIKSACQDKSNEEIMYLDIKSFYPSINLDLLRNLWSETCTSSKFPEKFTDLGLAFIEKYRLEQGDVKRPGLLIGPMFSHLLANLYLKNLDKTMKSITEDRYWRYVDDMVIVGKKNEIDKFSEKLKKEISTLGLEYHTELKTFRLQTSEWLANKNPVSNSLSKKWPRLIGQIRRLIIFYPERINDLKKLLDQMDVRLEILDYTREVKSRSLSKNLYKWIKRHTLYKKLHPKGISILIDEMRKDYFTLLRESLTQPVANELEEKTKVTKIKYLVGRLIYLSPESELKEIATVIKNLPELHIQYEIIKTILYGDVSYIVRLGTNATQAAAQVIKNKRATVTCQLDVSDNDVIVALSIFKFHGIEVIFPDNEEIQNSFYEFASGETVKGLDSEDSYLQEFIALHGDEGSRHSEMLNTLFDENEKMSFDVLNAAAGSSYYN